MPWRPCDWLILPMSVDGTTIPAHETIELHDSPLGTLTYRFEYARKGRRVYRRVPPIEWGGTWRE